MMPLANKTISCTAAGQVAYAKVDAMGYPFIRIVGSLGDSGWDPGYSAAVGWGGAQWDLTTGLTLNENGTICKVAWPLT